jgi:uncharacterized protein YdeI (YjbR/CyaY-like superfamily)
MKRSLKGKELLQVNDRRQWRSWLERNHIKRHEIWLVYNKKHTKKMRIAYNDAVEEALCFGWIDSIVKDVDEKRYAQRFSPRKEDSTYSQANIERMKYLIARKKVKPEIVKAFNKTERKRFRMPEDILCVLKENKEAWKNYKRMPKPYIRIRIGFIEGARKRPAEYQKRLNYFIRMTSKNKLFGFGGIEKHYQ